MQLAAQIVLIVLALVLPVVLRGPTRQALALAVLLVPVAVSAPGRAASLADGTRRDAGRGDGEAGLAAPRAATEGRNLKLLFAAEERIPWGSDYGIVRGELPADATAREGRARAYGIAWMQYRLAPRVAKLGADAPWVLVFDSTPEQAGISPRRAWRFGDDWLLER